MVCNMNKRGIGEGQPAELSVSAALALVREIAARPERVFVLRPRHRRAYVAIKSGNWRMNISGRSAGEELTCVVEIEWRECVLVATVFKP